jgi:MOSC domain-containing protein YiiM
VQWIGIRPSKRMPVQPVEDAFAEAGRGLRGDHRAARAGSHRQVTLIQHEHLAVIAELLGRDSAAPPELLRRNVVVSGVNLLSLMKGRFRIGEALLEGTGPCEPCDRMDEALGAGGQTAMCGHGGITAVILEGGTVRVGDAVTVETA